MFEDVYLQKLCEILLFEVAKRHCFVIEDVEVAFNHVHVIAQLRPSVSPARAIQLMKGFTSKLLFVEAEKKLRKHYWKEKGKRSIWGAGKFMASVGHITLDTAKDYVRNHKAHHAKFQTKPQNPHLSRLGRVNFF